MSFFKEASDAFLRYTEKIVHKTELYAKIGRLVVDIKRMENEIQKLKREIGEYVYTNFSEGTVSLQSDDQTIISKCTTIQELCEAIAKKREEIANLRKMEEGGNNRENTQQ